jgi:homoserine dehydrogenase
VHPTLIPTKRLIANVEGAMNAVLVKATPWAPRSTTARAPAPSRPPGGDRRPGRRDPHAYRRPRASRAAPRLPARRSRRTRRSCRWPKSRTGYYLRLRVEDKPGVLADITRILADQQISIDAMIQREPAEGESQTDIIMLTHVTREKNVDAAIAKIEALPVVKKQVIRLRMEELG